jgi:hypothetical protein
MDDSGVVVYDKWGVKVVAKGLESNERPAGLGRIMLPLYIENNSWQTLFFATDEITVNGVAVQGALGTTVGAGKRGYCEVMLEKTDLERKHIDKVEEVTFTLRAYNKSHRLFGLRFHTDPVTVTAK